MLIPLFSSHCWATWLGMRGSGHTRLHGENRWRRRGFFRPKAGSKAVAMDCADRVLSKVKYKKLTRKSPLAWDGTSHMVWLESPEAVVSEALPMACEEWVRWHEKELVLTKARAQKEKDARLRLKHLDALWFMMVPCPCSLSTFSAFAFVESRGYPRPRWNVWGSRFLSLLFIVYCNCMLLLLYVYIYIHAYVYNVISPLWYIIYWRAIHSALAPRIQAVNIAREHLSTLVPDAKTYLKELVFPDPDDVDIQRRLEDRTLVVILNYTELYPSNSFQISGVFKLALGLGSQVPSQWRSHLGLRRHLNWCGRHFLPSLFQKVEQEVSAMKQAQSQARGVTRNWAPGHTVSWPEPQREAL